MLTSGFPTSPLAAFTEVSQMADRMNLSIIQLCEKAKVSPSPVYRWKTNKRSYDVSIFGRILHYFTATPKPRQRKPRG